MYAGDIRYWPRAALYHDDGRAIAKASALHSSIVLTSNPGGQTLARVPPQLGVDMTCAHSSDGAIGGGLGGGGLGGGLGGGSGGELTGGVGGDGGSMHGST